MVYNKIIGSLKMILHLTLIFRYDPKLYIETKWLMLINNKVYIYI